MERKRLEQIAAAVEGAEAVIAAAANEQGHLFGAVHAGDIAENLRSQGFEIADEFVELGEHIKQVGAHKVRLWFDEGLTASVTVTVVAAGGTAEQAPAEEAKEQAAPENLEETPPAQ